MTLSAGVSDGGVTSDPGYGSCWENQLHGAAFAELLRLVWTVHVKPLLEASGVPAEPGLGAVGTQVSHSQFYNKKPNYLFCWLLKLHLKQKSHSCTSSDQLPGCCSTSAVCAL